MNSDSRSHQFKLRLTLAEWYDLLAIAECEETTVSDVVRSFITRRAHELRHPATRDVGSIADTLLDASRRLRTLARASPHFEQLRLIARAHVLSRTTASVQGEWRAPRADPKVFAQCEAAGGKDECDQGRTDAHDGRDLDTPRGHGCKGTRDSDEPEHRALRRCL
jgi:hypothetical protein